jgi:hypothetical protein
MTWKTIEGPKQVYKSDDDDDDDDDVDDDDDDINGDADVYVWWLEVKFLTRWK